MASHEATEIPDTHHEDTEEADGESGSDPHSAHPNRQARKGEPLVKRIEHEAQEAAEEGIEAATGRGIESSPSLPEDETENDDRSAKRHSGEASHDGMTWRRKMKIIHRTGEKAAKKLNCKIKRIYYRSGK